MLKAVPHAFFSWDFTILKNDVPIAEIDTAWFMERAEIDVEGQRYAIRRESWGCGRFFMETPAGDVIASVEKPSWLFRRYVVDFDGRRYELKALAPIARSFGLFDQERRIGTIRPDAILIRRTTLDLPRTMPVAVQVFLFWLVLILWRRAARSSS